jgi:hypothetical protein
MKQDTKQMMLFKQVLKKKLLLILTTAISTLIPTCSFLREEEAKIGIIQNVTNIIDDREHPMNEFLVQRVFQIVSRYEDANDSGDLKNDPNVLGKIKTYHPHSKLGCIAQGMLQHLLLIFLLS